MPAVSPLTPKEILLFARASDTSSVFMLGFIEQRVTFYAQQVRALNLADALAQEGYLKPRARIAVIGGGAAGMTAAAAIAAIDDTIEGLCREYRMRTERGLSHPQASRSQDAKLLGEG